LSALLVKVALLVLYLSIFSPVRKIKLTIYSCIVVLVVF
jgi:hypothetical protein